MACTGNKNSYFSEEEKEDSNAKEMLQGIWLNDETESPLMRVEGDTIFYADSQSAPIAFKIIRDTLYTYGNDTTYYKIDKQAEHIFWFHSISIKSIPYYFKCNGSTLYICIVDSISFYTHQRALRFIVQPNSLQ